MKDIAIMKDISTNDHIQRLCISIERRVRAECILRLQPSGPHAASVKARQREERAALKGLNRHLKLCLKLVEADRRKRAKESEGHNEREARVASQKKYGGTA